MREAQAAGGERVDIRRGDFTAVAAEVGVAQVVAEDEEDVGFLSGGGVSGDGGERDAGEQQGACDEATEGRRTREEGRGVHGGRGR